MGKEPVELKHTILRLLGGAACPRMLTTLLDACLSELENLPKLASFKSVLEKAKKRVNESGSDELFKVSVLLERNLGVLNKAIGGGKKFHEEGQAESFDRFVDLYVATQTMCFCCWLEESDDTDEMISVD
jgi:hypothetical protein